MTARNHRRWFRFGLRAPFVVAVAAGALVGAIAESLRYSPRVHEDESYPIGNETAKDAAADRAQTS